MAPKGNKTSKQTLPGKTLVIDNGAYTIKAGFVTEQPDADRDCLEIPNCLAKTARNQVLTGSELLNWTDFAETTFRRPLQKGSLVSWEAEKQIWDHEFLDPDSKLHVGHTASRVGSSTEALSVIRTRQTCCSPKLPMASRLCRSIATKWCSRSMSLQPIGDV